MRIRPKMLLLLVSPVLTLCDVYEAFRTGGITVSLVRGHDIPVITV